MLNKTSLVVPQDRFSNLNDLSQALLNQYQKNFPVSSNPYDLIAKDLECSEPEVLSHLLTLKDKGIITRIGPVFDHKRAGSSLLAAVSVPENKKKIIADIISQYEEVNHNYGREHKYNLWFVVTAPSQSHLDKVLDEIELNISYPILRLPMIKAYHIDLGFNLNNRIDKNKLSETKIPPTKLPLINVHELLPSNQQQELRVLIQDGLPITRSPYLRLANMLGLQDESIVMTTIQHWLNTGLIKRLGLVSNHHRLGFTSNAMVVWDLPEEHIDRIGKIFKDSGLVSLCYQRKRELPHWPYNLYCMIHSRDRNTVLRNIEQLKNMINIKSIENDVLFSNHQYKQKGGMYCVKPSKQDTHYSKGLNETQNLSIKNHLGVAYG